MGQQQHEHREYADERGAGVTAPQSCRGMRLGLAIVGILLVLVLVLWRRLVVHVRIRVVGLVALVVTAVWRQTAAAASEDAHAGAGHADAGTAAPGRPTSAGRSRIKRQLAKYERWIVGVHRLQAMHGIARVEHATWMVGLGKLLK